MKICAVKISDIYKEKLDKLYSLISLEEKNKIQRFINEKDRLRTLVGKIILRTMIIQEFGIENNNIIFEKNNYGKPYLSGHQEINFNISHSGDFVVCAINDNPIGIDIEEVKYIEYEEIAKSFFTKSEFDHITKNNSNIQLNKFYEIWTLKESYIKCCGKGLSIPLKSFSITIDEYENINDIIDNKFGKYIFERFDIESDYKMAACSLNSEISKKVLMIEQNDLINNYLSLI